MPKRKYAGSAKSSSKRAKLGRRWVKAKRKARAKARTTTIVRGPGPVPDRTIAKHKYVEEFASDGTRADWELNLNSTYSPRYSPSGGHQPYGRDTYAALYNRYRVFAVRYKVTFDAVSTATGSYRGMLLWNNALTAESNYLLTSERPHSRTCTFAHTSSKTLKGHLTLAKINGQTKTSYMGDDRFQAAVGSSPTENIILHMVMTDNGGTVLAAGIGTIRVELQYFVEWFDPLPIAVS